MIKYMNIVTTSKELAEEMFELLGPEANEQWEDCPELDYDNMTIAEVKETQRILNNLCRTKIETRLDKIRAYYEMHDDIVVMDYLRNTIGEFIMIGNYELEDEKTLKKVFTSVCIYKMDTHSGKGGYIGKELFRLVRLDCDESLFLYTADRLFKGL